MTDKEYQQKKRELWIDLALDEGNANEVPPSAYKRIFNNVFDRAYALGKQAQTITQEEIEKAAWDYAKDAYYPAPDYGWYESDDEQMKEVLENTFKAGVNFALGKQEKDAGTVIQGWVSRDKDKVLILWESKPQRNNITNDEWGMANGIMLLPSKLFPDLTWKSEPEPVEIIIRRKKK